MDMKKHMLICFFISMLGGREKEWGRELLRKHMEISKDDHPIRIVFGIV
jgi:hypothetical protein